jgi:undecaprenyl-diphosphatase
MSLDTQLLDLINGRWTCAALDWWSAIVTADELWWPLLLAAALALLWRGTPRCRTAVLLGLLVLVIGDGVFVRGGKLLTQRPRPGEVLQGVRRVHLARVEPRVLALGEPLVVRFTDGTPRRRSSRSMPSGHAWNSLALATLAVLCNRRWGWLAFVPAALVGYSRIYGGLHWPSDVLVSALLAPPATVLVVIMLERSWQAIARRFRPAWVDALPGLVIRQPSP